MRILLDTHAFLWFYTGSERLSTSVEALLTDPKNDCFLSVASICEMGIKASIGKLELRVDFEQLAGFMQDNLIELLPTSIAHIQALQQLPFHHRDPFDRLLIAQATAEKLTLASRDAVFPQYTVPVFW